MVSYTPHETLLDSTVSHVEIKKNANMQNAMDKKESKHSGLTTRQEAFCVYFVINDELRDNATHSYAQAYGFDLYNREKYPKDDAVFLEDEEDNDVDEDEISAHKRRLRKRYGGRTLVTPSSYDRAINTCAVNASQLLRRAKIQDHITKLRISLLSDDFVDSMLAHWVKDKKNPAASVAAIKEYNKLKSRVKDLVELSGPNGGPIVVESKRRSLLEDILTNNATTGSKSN